VPMAARRVHRNRPKQSVHCLDRCLAALGVTPSMMEGSRWCAAGTNSMCAHTRGMVVVVSRMVQAILRHMCHKTLYKSMACRYRA
jgi:hypothetical protein